MKQNELRFGNLVMDQLTGAWMKIETAGDRQIGHVIDRSKYPLPEGWQMVGIPLTPAVMFSCADVLKVDNQYRIYLPNRTELLFLNKVEGTQKYTVDIFSFGTNKFLKDVEYLHQIQNLYYTLTEEELVVQTDIALTPDGASIQ